MHLEPAHDQESFIGTVTLPLAPLETDAPYHLCEDTTLPYRSGHRAGFCRLRLFRPVERPISAATPAVALVTEQPDNAGLSLTNGIEVIAAAICRHYGLHPRHTILIEHYDDRERGYAARLPGRIKGEKFSCITFEEMQVSTASRFCHVRRPQWQPLAKAEVEAMLGQELP